MRRPPVTDWLLLFLCLISSGFGLVLIWSATRYDPQLHDLPLKQGCYLLLGVVLCLCVSRLDVEKILRRWWPLVLAGEFLLPLTLLTPLGTAGDTGNRSWLTLPGLSLHLQPAEFGKLLFLLLLALQLRRLKERGVGRPTSVGGLLTHGGLLCGVVFATSGDAGMTVLYGLLFLLLLWLGGVPLRWFLLMGGAGAAGAAAVWKLLPADNYWKMRFLVLFDPALDPQGIGYQQNRSLLALGSGQIWGQGYLQGLQTQSEAPSALPARYTDFIFSVCGEEFGLAGCVFVLLLLTGVILRCFWVGGKAPTTFLRLTAWGCGGTVLLQTVLNVAMCLSAAPVIGLTLPFFSYGGSSLLSLFLTMGVVGAVHRQRFRADPS